MLQIKSYSKALLAAYLLTLLWLVLFKFSTDIPAVLSHQARSLNLLPFADYSWGNPREMLDNLIFFAPLGLLLGVNYKQARFWQKVALVGLLSSMLELLQFALAIGVTDITDIIMNTLGGFLGVALYDASRKYIDHKKLDWFIVTTGTILLAALILFRLMFLRVRY